MSTLLCVPIMVQDEPTALADAAAARDAGADMVEFRVDEFFSGARDSHGELDQREVGTMLRLVAASALPCIVTCRAASEGGHYDGDDMARVALYERLGTAAPDGSGKREHPPQYLDIEFAAYSRSANLQHKVHLAIDYPALRRELRPGLILSMHDFNARPPDLLRRLSAMQEQPAARVIKVAYTARSIRDNLELFDLLTENAGGRPLIALGMGRFGLMSRVLAPKFGGFLTFGSLRPEMATAPGQPTVRELLDLYRFREIGPGTRVYGVIGWPVEHSLSPLVHNAGCEAVGHDGVYLPLPIAADEKDPGGETTYLSFKATIEAMLEHKRLDLAGLSVTMPFKEHLVRWAYEAGESGTFAVDIAREVQEIGAANTVKVDGRDLDIANTDAIAIRKLLDGVWENLAEKSVAIVGAGGVARAAVWACVSRGARVTLYNRTRDRAEKMVGELAAARQRGDWGRVVVADLAELESCAADVVINCTSVGMSGGPEPEGMAMPLERMRGLPGHALVMETVYRPVQTPLIRAALARGLRVIDGVQMFVEQAARQFEIWTGKPAPRGLFDRVCREALREKGKEP